MTKIKSSGRIVGRSPFSRGAVKGAFTGRKVSKGVVGNKGGVTRLFARDPSKRNSLIGTARDINPTTKNATIGVPSPRIVRAPQTAVRGATSAAQGATLRGIKRVVNRSANRNIIKR